MTKIIRLTEADLNNIIKKVLNEQKNFGFIDPTGNKKFNDTKFDITKNDTNKVKNDTNKVKFGSGFKPNTETYKSKYDGGFKPSKSTGFNPNTSLSDFYMKNSHAIDGSKSDEPKKKQSVYKPITSLTDPIQYGARGSQVKEIQNNLLALGYQLKADGDFGPMTKGKVIAFQLANKLKPTGIVDNETGGLLSKQAKAKTGTDSLTKNPFPQPDKITPPLKNPNQKEKPMPKTTPAYHIPNDFGGGKTSKPTSKIPPLLNPNTKPNTGYNPKNPLGV